jgi:Ca2+-binding RTX toxin-like protein
MDRITAHGSPSPTLERRETRATPAGNVTAQVSGGSILLTGDAGDNQIILQQTRTGAVIVSGINGTTVNGRQSVSLGSGTPSGVFADLGDGPDYLQVFDLFAGSLVVVGGNGDDSLYFTNSRAIGNVEVYGGADNDTVFLSGVQALNIIGLDGGAGTDSLHVDNSRGVFGSFSFNFERSF